MYFANYQYSHPKGMKIVHSCEKLPKHVFTFLPTHWHASPGPQVEKRFLNTFLDVFVFPRRRDQGHPRALSIIHYGVQQTMRFVIRARCIGGAHDEQRGEAHQKMSINKKSISDAHLSASTRSEKLETRSDWIGNVQSVQLRMDLFVNIELARFKPEHFVVLLVNQEKLCFKIGKCALKLQKLKAREDYQ